MSSLTISEFLVIVFSMGNLMCGCFCGPYWSGFVLWWPTCSAAHPCNKLSTHLIRTNKMGLSTTVVHGYKIRRTTPWLIATDLLRVSVFVTEERQFNSIWIAFHSLSRLSNHLTIILVLLFVHYSRELHLHNSGLYKHK